MHELVKAFLDSGLHLPQRLVDMLEDRPEHCTLRRGCGLTQATRYLAAHVNANASSVATDDLDLVGVWSAREVAALSNAVPSDAASGWRAWLSSLIPEHAPAPLIPVAQRIARLPRQFDEVAAQPLGEASRALLGLLEGVLLRRSRVGICLPVMLDKPNVGSCSQAEEFFLELAHGRVRRGGWVNLYLDEAGNPVLLEKMSLGESNSSMLLAAASVCDVDVPVGSSFATARRPDVEATLRLPGGWAYPLDALQGARFLRFTTLAVNPASRRDAFTAQVEAQLQGSMLSPLSTRIEDLRGFAQTQLQQGIAL